MADRYITAAQADQMRRRALAFYEPLALPRMDVLRREGDDYYIVRDDDPRLQGQPAAEPPFGAD